MAEAAMPGLSIDEAAAAGGVEVGFVQELVRLGILAGSGSAFTDGDVRRIGLMRALHEGGLPLSGLAAGLERGLLSLDFVDRPEYDRFAELSSETFRAAADRTGVPLDLLVVLRETTGFGRATPDSRLRQDELRVLPFLEYQVRLGFNSVAIERLLRAMGDNLRRIAEAEAEWWRSQITEPGLAAGRSGADVATPEGAERLPALLGQAMVAIYTAEQSHTWTENILVTFRRQLVEAGLHDAPDRPPAICFLDITGYTRLTQERGDQAAADLAETLARIVKRTSAEHGGRPVKWLGDGVMFIFRDPGRGVVAALEMIDEIAAASLPPAHVGLHAGQVVVQEGDYFGQTVNMAARIADFARPGEVLVSEAIVQAVSDERLVFIDIGPVDLKGVSGAVRLHAVRMRIGNDL